MSIILNALGLGLHFHPKIVQTIKDQLQTSVWRVVARMFDEVWRREPLQAVSEFDVGAEKLASLSVTRKRSDDLVDQVRQSGGLIDDGLPLLIGLGTGEPRDDLGVMGTNEPKARATIPQDYVLHVSATSAGVGPARFRLYTHNV